LAGLGNYPVVETDRHWHFERELLIGRSARGRAAHSFLVPVVTTNSMPKSQFLVGAFGLAAGVWDRADATVEVSREHSDFFVKNMIAILCEERIALTVFRPSALIYGGFPYGS